MPDFFSEATVTFTVRPRMADPNSYGTVYKLAPDGTLTSLVSFNGTDGENPEAEVIQGTDGNLYGTTCLGGAAADSGFQGYGTVFKVTVGGSLTTLSNLNSSTYNPVTPLVQGVDGNLATPYEGGGLRRQFY